MHMYIFNKIKVLVVYEFFFSFLVKIGDQAIQLFNTLAITTNDLSHLSFEP